MNTPEMTATNNKNTTTTNNNNRINESKQHYVDQLQLQILQSQIQRKQRRDYGRILHEYNKPARWYSVYPMTRSIYYYDPYYQRYLRQQSNSSVDIHSASPSIRQVNHSTLFPSKYHVNLQRSSNNHLQNRIQESQLKSIPTLPPIVTYKKSSKK